MKEEERGEVGFTNIIKVSIKIAKVKSTNNSLFMVSSCFQCDEVRDRGRKKEVRST